MTINLVNQIRKSLSDGSVVVPLAEDLPGSLEAAEDIRDQLAPTAERTGGFKLGATIAAVRANLGVPRQFFAAVAKERVFNDGEIIPLATVRQTGVESEYAFVLGRDLTEADRGITADALAAAIASVHPAIEIPGTRYEILAGHGGFALVADAGAVGALVIGPGQSLGDPARFGAAPVWLEIADGTPVEGNGAVIDGGPFGPLLEFVRTALARGYDLRAGLPIVTGSCTGYVTIPRGKRVTARFPALNSQVSTSFAIEA